jgi:DNA damage-binding protein 1
MDLHHRTLITTNVIDDLVIQVTDKSVRLMESKSNGILLDEWIPEDQSQITVASVNPTQCVLSTGHGRLIALTINSKKLELSR